MTKGYIDIRRMSRERVEKEGRPTIYFTIGGHGMKETCAHSDYYSSI
jgi:hypothetical protein